MELEIEYELSDWKTFQAYVEKRACKEGEMWWDSGWLSFILWFAVAFIFLTFFQDNIDFSWPTAVIVAFVILYFFGMAILNGIKIKRACQPLEGGSLLGRHKFIINDDGIISAGAGYEAKHAWSIVKRVEHTENAIYVFIDSTLAFIFPLSKVENAKELLAIIESNVTSNSSRSQ